MTALIILAFFWSYMPYQQSWGVMLAALVALIIWYPNVRRMPGEMT